MKLPSITKATILSNRNKVLLISAYGFEERALGWSNYQISNGVAKPLSSALIINYINPKGRNKTSEFKTLLKKLGVEKPIQFDYDILSGSDIESDLDKVISTFNNEFDEIILDISPLTKFLILLLLSKLEKFEGVLRIVYSEADSYAPAKSEFNKWKDSMKTILSFPSKGFGTILRAKCLSSIRMQGQPVTLIAFTSFNEQLVRYMLGSLTPYRLIFINGRPPHPELAWREFATQYIYRKLIAEYQDDNKFDKHGLLRFSASTFNYKETFDLLNRIYEQHGNFERIIVAATGSKMQTIGLYYFKKQHSDIHIEYPTPDSYYIKGFSYGVKNVFEIKISNFSKHISTFESIDDTVEQL